MVASLLNWQISNLLVTLETGEIIQECSVKKLFQNISQISQEKTYNWHGLSTAPDL